MKVRAFILCGVNVVAVPLGSMMTDRRRLVVIFCLFLALYAYFFQGGGWPQNTHFDMVRALVERHRLDITLYESNTGDVSRFQGRVYGAKSPGFSWAAAPVYAVLYQSELAAGVSPSGFFAINANVHILSIIFSGVPAAGLVVLLVLALVRQGVGERRAVFLSVVFGLGSLSMPYSSVFGSHNLTAFLLMLCWFLASGRSVSSTTYLLAGIIGGIAVTTQYLVGPLVLVLWIDAVKRNGLTSATLSFLPGAIAALVVLMINGYLCFGSPLASNYTYMSNSFRTPGALLGVFQAPEPARLWWLSFHPLRGALVTCPVYIISTLGFIFWALKKQPDSMPLFPAVVVCYFGIFALCFNSWTGGWGVGPRYLIPGLAFLYLYSGFSPLSKYAEIFLSVFSALLMLAVTSVGVMLPALPFGPPRHPYPHELIFPAILNGDVSINGASVLGARFDAPGGELAQWASYNVGELFGLEGLWSLGPPLGVICCICVVAFKSPRRRPCHGQA